MTASSLVNAIISRLEAVGYHRLSTPFQVASVRFDFTAVLQGQQGRAFDLVLIIDTSAGEFGDNNGPRTRQRIEALTRALDVSGSRLVLTTILAGAPLPTIDVDEISRICRVLIVEGIELNATGAPATEEAARDLDDRLRILLPLKLETTSGLAADLIGDVEKQLHGTMASNRTRVLLGATNRGPGAVTAAVRKLLEEALEPGAPN